MKLPGYYALLTSLLLANNTATAHMQRPTHTEDGELIPANPWEPIPVKGGDWLTRQNPYKGLSSPERKALKQQRKAQKK